MYLYMYTECTKMMYESMPWIFGPWGGRFELIGQWDRVANEHHRWKQNGSFFFLLVLSREWMGLEEWDDYY